MTRSGMTTPALTTVVDGRIWLFERPIWFSGVRLRVHTTVVRLDDGGLLLHSPAPVADTLAEELRALGPVRWLVIPNTFHHLGTPAAAALFPEAKVVGPASVRTKNPGLNIHLDIRDGAFGEQVPEVDVLPLEGVPFLDETVLYHRPTKTLLGADIVMCPNEKDHWTLRAAARLLGFYGELRVPHDVKKKIPDKAAAAQSVRAMLERPAERMIVGHADVIGTDCRDQLARAWRLEGVEV